MSVIELDTETVLLVIVTECVTAVADGLISMAKVMAGRFTVVETRCQRSSRGVDITPGTVVRMNADPRDDNSHGVRSIAGIRGGQ